MEDDRWERAEIFSFARSIGFGPYLATLKFFNLFGIAA